MQCLPEINAPSFLIPNHSQKEGVLRKENNDKFFNFPVINRSNKLDPNMVFHVLNEKMSLPYTLYNSDSHMKNNIYPSKSTYSSPRTQNIYDSFFNILSNRKLMEKMFTYKLEAERLYDQIINLCKEEQIIKAHRLLERLFEIIEEFLSITEIDVLVYIYKYPVNTPNSNIFLSPSNYNNEINYCNFNETKEYKLSSSSTFDNKNYFKRFQCEIENIKEKSPNIYMVTTDLQKKKCIIKRLKTSFNPHGVQLLSEPFKLFKFKLLKPIQELIYMSTKASVTKVLESSKVSRSKSNGTNIYLMGRELPLEEVWHLSNFPGFLYYSMNEFHRRSVSPQSSNIPYNNSLNPFEDMIQPLPVEFDILFFPSDQHVELASLCSFIHNSSNNECSNPIDFFNKYTNTVSKLSESGNNFNYDVNDILWVFILIRELINSTFIHRLRFAYEKYIHSKYLLSTNLTDDKSWNCILKQDFILRWKSMNDGNIMSIVEGFVDLPFLSTLSLITQIDFHNQWVPYLDTTELLYHPTYFSQFVRQKIRLPWPLDDRCSTQHVILINAIEEQDDMSILIYGESIPDVANYYLGLPLASSQKGVTNIQVYSFVIQLKLNKEDLNKTNVKIMSHMDPRLSFFPPKLQHFFAKQLISKLFENLKKVVLKFGQPGFNNIFDKNHPSYLKIADTYHRAV